MRFLIQTAKDGEIGYLVFAIFACGLVLAVVLGAFIYIAGNAVSAVNCLASPESARCTLLFERDQASRL